MRQLEETRAALRNSEARYRRLMDSLPALVIELDPHGKILSLSESFCGATGYAGADLVGRSWWDVFFPGEQAQPGQALQQHLAEGDVRQYKVSLTAQNGDLVQLELNTANQYGPAGELENILASALVITPGAPSEEDIERQVSERTAELQAANKRLETVLHSLPVGVWIADANGEIIEKNEMSDQIWGMETPAPSGIDFSGGISAWWADSGEKIPSGEWALARALHKGEISLGEVINIMRQDGSQSTIMHSAVPIYNDEGDINGAVAINMDITHQRQLEHQADHAAGEARQKAEELDAVFRAMSDAVIVFDEQGRLSSANPAAINTYGFDPHGMHQSELVEHLHLRYPDHRPVPYDQLPASRAMRGETVLEEQLVLTDSQGRQVSILDSAAPLFDDQNQMVGAVVVWRDITEREALTRQAKLERDTLETVLESIREEVWVCDAQARLTRINAAAQRAFNLEEDTSIPVRSLIDQLGIYDEQGQPRLPEESPLLRSLKGETVEGLVERLKHPDTGEWIYRQVYSTPLVDKAGQIFGAVAVIRDVTHRVMAETLLEKHLSELEEQVDVRTRELADAYSGLLAEIAERKLTEETLRQSEERFRLVIETIQDYAIYALDPEGHVSSWNSGAQAIKGYRAEEIIGQNYSRFYLPEDIAEGLPTANLEIAAARGRYETDSWRVRKDGTFFWANIIITALRDETGKLRGYAKVVRDNTRRKQADEALRRQTGFVRLLQEVAAAANQASSVEVALKETMVRVCKQQGWQGAHAFHLDDGAEIPFLHSMRIWYIPEEEPWLELKRVTEELSLQRGEGLAGRVLTTGQPVWLENIDANVHYLRREAARLCGLKTGVALPLMVGEKVVAVLEFFTQEELALDEDLMEVLKNIGTQLGRVFERQLSEENLRQSEARFRTIFENAPLGIELVRIGEGGVACNPAMLHIMGADCGDLYSDWFINAEIQSSPANTGLTHKLLASAAREFAEELGRGERQSYRLELPLRRKDGSWLWGRLSVSLVAGGKDQQAPQAIVMLEDISERKQMEADLAELKHRQIEGREMERLHLSQELHDGPMQDLYALSFNMQAYFEGLPEVVERQPLKEMQTHLQQVVQTLRVICGELRPPTLAPFGLEKAIRSHASNFQLKFPNLVLGLDLMEDGQTLPAPTRLALYRIYQQALSNVIRHAQARHILVRLQLDESEVRLEIVDDGQGFELPSNWIDLARQGYLGLLSVQERAEALGGTLQVESTPGRGTRIRAVVPRSTPRFSVWLNEGPQRR